MKKTLYIRFEYFLRDLRCRRLFAFLKTYCRGNVLDVGGWDFFLTAKEKGISCDHWTSLEYNKENILTLDDERYECRRGDGCQMTFEDNTFDTVINIQVLEHVFEPIKMVRECARVLKPGGYGVFMIPQTGVIHGAPNDYGNFNIFWARRAMTEAGLEIVEEEPIGGMWSSMASHLFFLMSYTIRRKLKSPTGCRRNLLFYVLYPGMILYALVNIPICLFFSLGDLREEPNNNLIVVRKPSK